MTRRARVRVATAIAAILLAHVPTAATAQRLGVFFDSLAVACDAPISTGFGRAHAFVFAFVHTDSLVGGVAFRLSLPSNIRVVAGSLTFPRNVRGDLNGNLTDGVDVRFALCATGPVRIRVAEFEFEDTSLGGPPRPNLKIELKGSGLDSVMTEEPQFRICDPSDPLGEGLGVYQAMGVDAILNCTVRCGCTTALVPKRWGDVKSRFR